MAGTCNDCGASTWGRYRICPDCRKARKRKNKTNNINISGHWHNKNKVNSDIIKRYVCKLCKYQWISKKHFGVPASCPNCKKTNIVPFIKTKQGKEYLEEEKNRELREKESRRIIFERDVWYNKKTQKQKNLVLLIFVFSLISILFILYNSNSTNEINPSIEESSTQLVNEIPIEDNLIDFCRAEFLKNGVFNINKMEELKDFSMASNWIGNNYISSALTQEQREQNVNYIIENQLPKQSYPIVITYGSKKDGQLTSQGFYYCNENGVI